MAWQKIYMYIYKFIHIKIIKSLKNYIYIMLSFMCFQNQNLIHDTEKPKEG